MGWAASLWLSILQCIAWCREAEAAFKQALSMQAAFQAAVEEQRQVIAKHGHELSMEALNDMKVSSTICRM